MPNVATPDERLRDAEAALVRVRALLLDPFAQQACMCGDSSGVGVAALERALRGS